ncbi:DeoR/GlpR family DNA-binding transcription regulator [Mycobacterium antarcticum]|uniref:DeoR/GlpR family DNA-binding transcription regulator n=1 Tax=Mycolicibacterium sp. TUM20984 TaxID=3023368 RepID=UPI0023947288|nr:DeoR/GlpR family DNA-binding transcription regulator [Mycolicibacterium sp. TUM20984]GLP80004.1 DeoR family transcriptional regulator [Mycolicibacterium sp. TUM20984]
MNKTERQTHILGSVQAAGRVKVTELAEALAVSEMTVRRDLEEMEGGGLLVRVHGGAASTTSRSFEPGFAVRSSLQVEAKQRIGRAAADLVRDGETLIVDAGTTTLHVAEALRPELRLRVMALSLRIADVLADQPNVTLMIPGGRVRPHERSFVGAVTLSTFENLVFDTAILTTGGIDVEHGITEYEYDDAETKRAALRSARRSIIVADATKLGAVAFARLCPVDDIDVVVTDASAPAAQVAALRDAGVDVVLA